ncbi:hypothetical protein [Spirosoma utsteinense]|uniref:Uncharacterized protein n=1 Tax=Spirosoma utsteinense TaxID=2585773 RepID=A0ABR6W129_9BACT|nr:hypothetical protein [Spirosoma utsteinense]MBC3790298.1 hypothetical protein [Spirosoma utsteinense]
MSDAQRQDWLNMKAILADYLIIVEQELLHYSIRDDDEKYTFLINKAVDL